MTPSTPPLPSPGLPTPSLTALGLSAPSPVRRATVSDGRKLIDLLAHLAVETEFMVVTVPDARRDLSAVVDYLRAAADSATHVTFVVQAGPTLVGMLVTSSDPHPAKIGVVEVDLGVRLDWQRQGLGRQLLEAAEAWAIKRGAYRMQLRVMVHNAQAIALYKKFGFEIEGTLVRHLKIGDRFIDQYTMAKLLG